MQPVGFVPLGVFVYGVLSLPLQGMWNCFIYFRPRYIQQQRERDGRKKNMEDSLRRSSNPSFGAQGGGHNRSGSIRASPQQDQPMKSATTAHSNGPSAASQTGAIEEEIKEEEA